MTNDGDDTATASVRVDVPSARRKLSFGSDSVGNGSWTGDFEQQQAADDASAKRAAAREAKLARAKDVQQNRKEEQRIKDEFVQRRAGHYADSGGGGGGAGNLPALDVLGAQFVNPFDPFAGSPRAKITRASRKKMGRDLMNYLIQMNRMDPAEYKREARDCPSWTDHGLGAVASHAKVRQVRGAAEKQKARVEEVASRKKAYLDHIREKGPPQKVYAGLLKDGGAGAGGSDNIHNDDSNLLRVNRQKELLNSGSGAASSAEAQQRARQHRQRQQQRQQRQEQQRQRQERLRGGVGGRSARRKKRGGGGGLSIGSNEDDDLNSWGDRSYEVAEQFMAQSTTRWAQNVEKNTLLYPSAFIRPNPFIQDDASIGGDSGGGSGGGGVRPGIRPGRSAGMARPGSPSFAGAGSLAEVVFEGGDIYGQLDHQSSGNVSVEARLFAVSGGHGMYGGSQAGGLLHPLPADGPRPGTGGRLRQTLGTGGAGAGVRAGSPAAATTTTTRGRPGTAPAAQTGGQRGGGVFYGGGKAKRRGGGGMGAGEGRPGSRGGSAGVAGSQHL